jgi:hypothetical protein
MHDSGLRHKTRSVKFFRRLGRAELVPPEEHAVARAALERAVEPVPGQAYAWAMLSFFITE